MTSLPRYHQSESISADFVALERLEYGKLCAGRNGPVLDRAEYRVLGHSPGLRADVVSLCNPSNAGLGPLEDPVRDEVFTHGTVVRPVYRAGRISTLGYRLCRRPEDGDGGSRRRYWLGRYLFAAEGEAGPWSFFTAFDDEPVVGLDGREAGHDGQVAIEPLHQPRGGQPAFTRDDQPFLIDALFRIVSGVPVAIRLPMDENTFFRLAQALWSLLPIPLRPLFSAGYGVSREVTTRLALSCAVKPSGAAATYDPVQRQWTPPQNMSKSSSDDALIPGRMYVREAFSRTADGERDLLGAAPDTEHFVAGESLDINRLQGPLVAFSGSHSAARLFRAVGLRALDCGRFRQLSAWLDDHADGDPESLSVSSGEYHTGDFADRAITKALVALTEKRTRARGEYALWRSLNGRGAERAEQIIEDMDRASDARVRALIELANGRLIPTLQALARACREGVGEKMAKKPAAALHTLLDESLDDNNLDRLAHRHGRWLADANGVPDYRDWAYARRELLQNRLTEAGQRGAFGAASSALRALAEICNDPAIDRRADKLVQLQQEKEAAERAKRRHRTQQRRRSPDADHWRPPPVGPGDDPSPPVYLGQRKRVTSPQVAISHVEISARNEPPRYRRYEASHSGAGRIWQLGLVAFGASAVVMAVIFLVIWASSQSDSYHRQSGDRAVAAPHETPAAQPPNQPESKPINEPKRQPDPANEYEKAGQGQLRAGELGAATVSFAKALRTNRQSSIAAAGLARVAMADDQLSMADAWLALIPQAEGEDSFVLLARAELALRSDKPDDSATLLEKLRSIDSKDPHDRVHLRLLLGLHDELHGRGQGRAADRVSGYYGEAVEIAEKAKLDGRLMARIRIIKAAALWRGKQNQEAKKATKGLPGRGMQSKVLLDFARRGLCPYVRDEAAIGPCPRANRRKTNGKRWPQLDPAQYAEWVLSSLASSRPIPTR